MARTKAITTLVYFMLVMTSVAHGKGKRAPDIFVKDRIWDFGIIEQHKVITHEFIIQNKGNADLIIEKVRSS